MADDQTHSSTEIHAIEACAKALDPFDKDQRRRILAYLIDLYALPASFAELLRGSKLQVLPSAQPAPSSDSTPTARKCPSCDHRSCICDWTCECGRGPNQFNAPCTNCGQRRPNDEALNDLWATND